jgi:hypothetical protein
MLNCFEKYLVHLLQGNLTYDGTVVPVTRNFSNAPSLPVVTLDLSGGVVTNYLYSDTDKTEVVYQHCTSHINLNLWCNTEDEREAITEQILSLYLDEIHCHYRFCGNFDGGHCSFLDEDCPCVALGSEGKFQCPRPFEYDYTSLAEREYVLQDTIRVEQPFFMDELERHPPLLRSVFRCSADYEVPVRRVGRPNTGGIGFSGLEIH